MAETRTYETAAYQTVTHMYTVTVAGDYLTEDEWRARARRAAEDAQRRGVAVITAGPIQFDNLRGGIEMRRVYADDAT